MLKPLSWGPAVTSNLSIQNSNNKFPSRSTSHRHYIGLYVKYTQYMPQPQKAFKSQVAKYASKLG